jgi:hypothetical protein
MATIKIIKDVELVYSAETIQGKIELDGEIVEFRYAEDTKANISFYILVNDKWETKFDDKYNIIFDSCQRTDINKDSKSGEEWDAEEEEE